jgi:hypothetical protein
MKPQTYKAAIFRTEGNDDIEAALVTGGNAKEAQKVCITF